ncbi:MAG: NAD(P)/FAD-dependent oxidoreductase [Planctomycetota bacterium]
MGVGTVIVGGGLAGLNCARRLHEAKRDFVLLEASDRTGGRVRTDTVTTPEGDYLIDRGFQVLLTAYPHAADAFDYDSLELGTFYPGALVWYGDAMHRVADPRRRMGDALKGFRTPIATTRDKIRLGEVFLRVLAGKTDSIWERPDRPAVDALKDAGFADSTIERFFRPFFGGVFFDRELQTSSRMLEFCMRMFAQGRTCVPAAGMGQLAVQLTSRLPADAIHVNAKADHIERDGESWRVHVNGQSHEAKNVVVATEGDLAGTLVGEVGEGLHPPVRWRQTATLAYAVDDAPTKEAILVLDGEGEGPVNHLATMSAAGNRYAPPGKHLVYANIVDPVALEGAPDDATLDAACRPQLRRWFGDQADGWTLLNIDRIERALPDQSPPWLSSNRPVELGQRLFACGDWLENASIDGALASGRRCADAVLATSG